jgi:hypothetical protein
MENRKYAPAHAIPPSKRVRRAIRRSVTAYGAASSVSIATPLEPPQNVANAGVKTQPSENQHQNGLSVQPSVQQIPKEAAHNNRGYQDKG